MTARPLRVLFVCYGNICRSPTAEALFKKRLADTGRETEFTVKSAGIIARGDDLAAPETVQIAAEHGVDMRGHLSRPLTAEQLVQSDLVIAMDRMNVEYILNLVPDLGPRLKLLLSYDSSGGHGLEVNDPIGQPLEVYRATYRQIEAGVEGLLAALTRGS